jgi:hypothetical protein
MSNLPIYELLAQAFASEGVDQVTSPSMRRQTKRGHGVM